MVAILEAISDPKDTEKMKKASECIKELQHKKRSPRSKGDSQDPSLPVEWLHPKEGRHINSLDSLLYHEDLVKDYLKGLKGQTPQHQHRAGKIIDRALFEKNITKWEGVVSDIFSDWKGIISLKKHIDVSFVPINVLPHMPNQGDTVRFCLAFHWTGPTAWYVDCQSELAKTRKSRSAFHFSTRPEEDDSDSDANEKADDEGLLPMVGESLHTQTVRPPQIVFAEDDEGNQWGRYLNQEMQGIIWKRFPDKGYGQIYHPNFQSSLFFHAKQIVPPVDSLESIELYSVVSFTVGKSERGPRAMNIKTVVCYLPFCCFLLFSYRLVWFGWIVLGTISLPLIK